MKSTIPFPCTDCILYALCRTKLKSEYDNCMENEIELIETKLRQNPNQSIDGDKIRFMIFAASIVNQVLGGTCSLFFDYLDKTGLMSDTVRDTLTRFDIKLPLFEQPNIELVRHIAYSEYRK